ncbi:S1C family serine protease [Bailinhaonella thermotolerans]|uniref:PDZ domain-containing protein n=1 Tax=Bailinhaonella thermotolerans TaxID=1070861 RepID=A0A3A4B2H7_9ACTN|nr:trypsin-like peptidase domain-containing protein [Bailinhaonella thermotolerans]RJL32197.1 PDZ domain-containing protein [Bailinhaonella thermotolerans]
MKTRTLTGAGLAAAAVIAVSTACAGGGASPQAAAPVAARTTAPAAPAATQAPPGDAVALERAYEQVVRQVLPSVVQINTESGLGSGIVLDGQGHVVTNAHVVGDSRTFQVRLASGGRQFSARLVGTYPGGDLAVIRVEGASQLQPARFGDSGRLRVGQIVMAMGNPLGLSGSVTNGIVSALDRTVTEPGDRSGRQGATMTGMIQTSAPINPGNSGGALVNLSGEVVGMPTLAARDPELGEGAAPGIGFAIPSNTITEMARQLIQNGRVTDTNRAALNVRVVTVADRSGRPAGVSIAQVEPGGAAEKAGLRPGDVILAVNDKETPTTQELSEALAGLKPGDTARVQYSRNGQESTANVRLGELPGD